jgi:hypothetical protein
MKLLLPFFFLAGSLFSQNKPEADRPVLVMAAKGWFLGAREIAQGDHLSAIAELTSNSPNDLILACGPAGWLSYTCEEHACRVPVCATKVEGIAIRRVDPGATSGAPRAPSAPGMLQSFLRHQPKPPETLGVRAGGNPNDAVVLQTADTVHWAPALVRVLEGSYCFRLSPLPANSPTAPKIFNLNWDRSVESEGIAPVPNLRPGVYLLVKGVPGPGPSCLFDDPDAASVWVVAAPDPAFTRLNTEWKAYGPWLRQLEQSGASPAVVSTVRRAILSSLADSIEPQ